MSSELKTKFNKEIMPSLKKELGVDNIWALPKLEKVVVNVGTGKIIQDKDKLKMVEEDIRKITGQSPVKAKAKKSIAGFKTRAGMEIGLNVTLRKNKMWQFLDRFISAALPRVRDFQGIKLSGVDQGGNLNIGIKEQIIFPEISPDQVQYIFPLQVTVVSSAKNREEGLVLYKALGFPLKEK